MQWFSTSKLLFLQPKHLSWVPFSIAPCNACLCAHLWQFCSDMSTNGGNSNATQQQTTSWIQRSPTKNNRIHCILHNT